MRGRIGQRVVLRDGRAGKVYVLVDQRRLPLRRGGNAVAHQLGAAKHQPAVNLHQRCTGFELGARVFAAHDAAGGDDGHFAAQQRGLGTDVSRILYTKEGRMGVYYAEHGAAQRGSNVVYDREGSTISLLPPSAYDFDSMLDGVTDELLMNREQYAQFVEKATYWLYDRFGELKLMVMDDFGYFPLTPKLRFLCQRWDGCPAGRRVIGIRANGDVLPCLSLGSEYVEANLRKRPLREIWCDPGSFPRFRRKSANLTGKCAKCPMGSECKAGCTAMAVSQTGTMTETPFCIRQLETERIVREIAG